MSIRNNTEKKERIQRAMDEYTIEIDEERATNIKVHGMDPVKAAQIRDDKYFRRSSYWAGKQSEDGMADQSGTLILDGVRVTYEWAVKTHGSEGLTRGTFKRRLKRGYGIDHALQCPTEPYKKTAYFIGLRPNVILGYKLANDDDGSQE